ncbi:MAG TPA: DnrO protein [Rhodanobacter sp.]
MKLVTTLVALACSFGLTVAAQAAPQHAHEHHAAPAATSAETAVPVPAQRWAPDASLKSGIRRAYTAVDQLKHHEMGHMSAAMAVDRATEVEAAVTYMFANCKLAAEPDAALHGILVPLLSAAQALKADPQNVKAVGDMRAALAHYPQYFNDPGWDQPAPIEHVMHDEP